MGLIDLTRDLDNIVAGNYSDARGPVVRGEHTELTLVQFQAGEGARTHSHEAEQFVVVVEGRIRFHVGDETFDVVAGQAAFIPSSVPHATEALEISRALSFKNLSNPAYEATSTAS
jgi:quercetin dioxygenase-like cupin family protein